MRKVMWRLLPLMTLMFLINQLDRVNISFAALAMNRDIGLTPLGGNGEALRARIERELPLMRAVAARADIRVD